MSRTRPAFGPSALATPANALTALRLAAGPVFAVAVAEIGPVSWLLWAIWAALAFSDSLDGQLARRHGTTRSGAFLDPLADKFLVLGALAALAHAGAVGWLPVLLVAGREVAMSGYRTLAGRRGVSIPARPLAKLKTLVQDLAVGFALFPPTGGSHPEVARTLLWAAVALTWFTGAQYVLDSRRLQRGSAGLAARAPGRTAV